MVSFALTLSCLFDFVCTVFLSASRSKYVHFFSRHSHHHVSNAIEIHRKKRNGKLSYGASSSTPPAKITCTFVWYARHHQPRARRTFAYKHTPLILSEVYQFIFFLWCIGNLIFSSIWKEKCSLYSLAAFHCVHQMLSNSLLFRFSSFHSALILCSSHFSLTLSLSLVLLFLFAVFVTVYLPLPCQTTAQFGFSSHVWQLFYRSLWCVCFAVACFPPFFCILSTTWMWLPLS